MASNIHISVKAEPLVDIFGFPITNSLVLSWAVIVAFLLLAFFYTNQSHSKHKNALFYTFQSILMYVYKLIESVLHDKTAIFFPLLGAYFFYILVNNWVGIMPTVGSVLIKPFIYHEISESREIMNITNTEYSETIASHNTISDKIQDAKKDESHSSKIPLLRSNNADLNATLALAVITMFYIQYFGFKYHGLGYLKKFFNFSSPIMAFVGILELISEFARILSFAFRLFGNILAGEILITIVASLLHPIVSFVLVPFFTLEIMAGAIQALVFTMISTVLIGMATSKAHH
jgi:F-type H+-transporting ATPase subunit a